MTAALSYKAAKAEFIKIINKISGRYSPDQVFTDFVTMAAMSISNSVMFKQEREDKYMELIKKYTPDEQKYFPELLGLIVQGLNAEFGDFLGEAYMGLDMGNKNTGQFFTPYSLSRFCASVNCTKEIIDKAIADKGYIGINEPSCGGGGMIIAFLDEMKNKGYNFQTQSLTIAQDIDYRCAYMCYVMLSLMGAPAIVCIGNTLKVEVWEELRTPFYVLNWYKFRGHRKSLDALENVKNAPSGDNNTAGVYLHPEQIKTPQTGAEQPTTGQLLLF